MPIFRKKQTEDTSGRRRPSLDAQTTNRAQAFSYYARRSDVTNNTGRGVDTTEPTRITRLSNWKPVSIITLVLLLFLYMTILVGKPSVAHVSSSGTAYFVHDDATYSDAAAKVLNESIFNKSKLTVDNDRVSKELKSTFPELKNVSVQLSPLSPSPKIVIEPFSPALILTTLNNAAYLMDENGRALIPASQITDMGELSVPTVQDKSGIQVRTGQQALSSDTVSFIKQVVTILAAVNITPRTIVLPDTANQLNVTIDSATYYVTFNLMEDAKQQTGAFLAVKERLEQENNLPTEYIDVRVPERAYIK